MAGYILRFRDGRVIDTSLQWEIVKPFRVLEEIMRNTKGNYVKIPDNVSIEDFIMIAYNREQINSTLSRSELNRVLRTARALGDEEMEAKALGLGAEETGMRTIIRTPSASVRRVPSRIIRPESSGNRESRGSGPSRRIGGSMTSGPFTRIGPSRDSGPSRLGRLTISESGPRIRASRGHTLTELMNLAMPNAAEKGDMGALSKMIERGGDNYDGAMIGAARGGYREIVSMMYAIGGKDINSTMVEAAENGYVDIVKDMIEAGATSYEASMVRAREKDYVEIIEILEEEMP